jgi:hypothetical protein
LVPLTRLDARERKDLKGTVGTAERAPAGLNKR